MDVLFTKDESDRSAGWMGAQGRDRLVVPLALRCALRLSGRGVSGVRLPIDWLEPNERESICDEAKALSRTWHKGLHHNLFYKGIDLLDCCRLQMMAFFQDVLTAEIIAPRLLADLRPRRAFFTCYPTVASIDRAMHDGTADILEAVLQRRFREAGINVDILRSGTPARGDTGMAVTRENCKRFVGRAARSIGFRVGLRRLPPSDARRLRPGDVPKGTPVVVGLASGYDVMVVWPILRAIAARVDGVPFIINIGPTLPTSTTRSGLRGDNDVRFLFVGDLPEAGGSAPEIRKFADQVFAALSNGMALPDCLRNPLLKCQFDALFGRLVPSALHAAQRAVAFFQEYPSGVYVDDYCAGEANRAWVEAGNQAGIPTLMAPHGAVNLLEFHDYNTQWALAWGELGRQNLIAACPDKENQVIVAGDPSMEALRVTPGLEANEPRTRVLLLTGGFLQQTWSDMDLGGFLATWQALLRVAAERPHLEFILRPHPGDRDLAHWYREMLNDRSRNFRLLEGGRLEDALPAALCSVLVGKPGTAGLVSALAGVPFVYLDTMLCRRVPGYEIWQDKNGVPRITTLNEFGRQIDRLSEMPTERMHILRENRRFRAMYLSPFNPETIVRAIGVNGSGLSPAGAATPWNRSAAGATVAS